MSRKKHKAGPPRSAEDISSDKEAQSWIKEVIDADTCRLYGCLYDEISHRELHELTDLAESMIAEYGSAAVIRRWEEYLYSRCTTPESVVNFANLFWCYGGYEYRISDACRFLGYIFYRIGFDPDTYDYGEDKYDVTGILDSIATCVMVKAGYGHADQVRNPYYTPENDPLIMAEVRAFRQTDL